MRKKTVNAEALSISSSRAYHLKSLSDHPQTWIPVTGYEVTFARQAFVKVCDDLVMHPEWNSSSILRCEVLDNTLTQLATVPVYQGFTFIRHVRRKLLPRRPMDGPLEQICCFYEGTEGNSTSLLVMLPIVPEDELQNLPYYHPEVAGMAFIHRSGAAADNSTDGDTQNWLQVSFLPLDCGKFAFDTTKPYWPEDSRTYRTALQLLTVVAKHGVTATADDNNYVKRVVHDKIVKRDVFQDAYKLRKAKYTWIIEQWKENTDPLKHVLEDVAIATFLICLWKDMYPNTQGHPPGGFVDVGCGNGLLVYILQNEGYEGYGLDLRARKSWALWGSRTKLGTTALSPPELCLSSSPPFPSSSFLIGNHADELTPWMPLLASLTPDSAFMNIPCCLHTFTGHFVRQEHVIDEKLCQLPHIKDDMAAFDSMSSEKGGRYAAYIAYVTELTIRAGWRPEREALRIPSTKNWALIGRYRIWDNDMQKMQREIEIRAWITEIVAKQSIPTWKPREPEGKDH